MRDASKSKLLTPGEVAALFRVDPKTVTRWAKAGRISAVRTPGGHCRFRQADVDALLEANTPIIEGSVSPTPGVAEEVNVRNLVDAAHAIGYKTATVAQVTVMAQEPRRRHTANFTPGEPFVSEAFGPREGYVVGTCRHAVAQSEWNAGFRKCERC